MAQVFIENPILNSPFEEPTRHFRFADDGITDEIVESRRVSSYFMPIPAAKKKGKQLAFDTEWTRDRARPDRERKLFFCQIEALETAIYLTEVANKYGDAWIENYLRRFNDDANPLLFRIASKMATGSGKTVVMAMLIAWQVLNKLANAQDARFSDTFLLVTPGITIRDRLRVLLPNDPQNDYRQRDILPAEWADELGKAKILITNFHGFKPRELGDAARLTKTILSTAVAQARSRRIAPHGVPPFEKGGQGGISGEINLIIEVTGEKRKDKEAKVATARTLWVPAVNNLGGFGRWAFVEITDPWNAQQAVRVALTALGASPQNGAEEGTE